MFFSGSVLAYADLKESVPAEGRMLNLASETLRLSLTEEVRLL